VGRGSPRVAAEPLAADVVADVDDVGLVELGNDAVVAARRGEQRAAEHRDDLEVARAHGADRTHHRGVCRLEHRGEPGQVPLDRLLDDDVRLPEPRLGPGGRHVVDLDDQRGPPEVARHAGQRRHRGRGGGRGRGRNRRGRRGHGRRGHRGLRGRTPAPRRDEDHQRQQHQDRRPAGGDGPPPRPPRDQRPGATHRLADAAAPGAQHGPKPAKVPVEGPSDAVEHRHGSGRMPGGR
jgi:hypothetical protein